MKKNERKLKALVPIRFKCIILILISLVHPVSSIGQNFPVEECKNDLVNEGSYLPAEEIQGILDSIAAAGVPGMTVTIYKNGKWQSFFSGYAKKETSVVMGACHLQYLQSISKLYLAVLILYLEEQKRLSLTDPISSLLPSEVVKYIPRADEISIKMLLNHTSGIPEYNMNPNYVNQLLSDPTHPFELEDYVAYSSSGKLDDDPGSRFSYRNTNYVLLALIANEVLGYEHQEFMKQQFFEPHSLNQTFYEVKMEPESHPTLVNSYWDKDQDARLVNATFLQRANVSRLAGDDGIITTGTDAIRFLISLFEDRLLSEASLAQMMNWVYDEDGSPRYGLGLDYSLFAGQVGYGHSGGGIGAGSQLYYFPDSNTYVFAAMNLGTITYSPIHDKVIHLVDRLYALILGN